MSPCVVIMTTHRGLISTVNQFSLMLAKIRFSVKQGVRATVVMVTTVAPVARSRALGSRVHDGHDWEGSSSGGPEDDRGVGQLLVALLDVSSQPTFEQKSNLVARQAIKLSDLLEIEIFKDGIQIVVRNVPRCEDEPAREPDWIAGEKEAVDRKEQVSRGEGRSLVSFFEGLGLGHANGHQGRLGDEVRSCVERTPSRPIDGRIELAGIDKKGGRRTGPAKNLVV
jgi:hypothetical protein